VTTTPGADKRRTSHRNTTDRVALAAVTVIAVLAACLATSLTPGGWLNPPLTWACAYTTAVLGVARAAHLPAGRTLVASGLMLATTITLLLTALKAVIDQALTLLAQLNARGLAALNKEATT
jgi:hypothetical protein